MLALIGKKAGMTQVFDSEGNAIPVTVIKIEPNLVIQVRSEEKNGYNAALIGAFDIKKDKLAKPVAGQFADGLEAKRFLYEMRDFDLECKTGDKFGVEILEKEFFVDIIGTSKGKGFQGVIKRHGFKGGRDTHGSKFHRSHGSTGQNTQPARTLKGVKMAGRMGNVKTTTQNLKVVKVDTEKQVILVKGAVPGRTNGIVIVRAAIKK